MGNLRKFCSSRWVLGIFFLLIVIGASIYLNLHFPKVPDADSFYHYGHASVYRETGLWQKSFPWTQFSIINLYQGDIWYGFHVLLMPFSATSDPVFGIKLGSIFSTILVFLLLAIAIYRLDRPNFYIWFFIFVTCSPTLLFRLFMLRPHPISLALSVLLLSLLVIPGPLVLFFVIGFLFSWIHLALSWVPILIYLSIVGFFLIMKLIYKYRFAKKNPEKKLEDNIRKESFWKRSSYLFPWAHGLVLLIGLVAGTLARPNPLGALKIAYVQVIEFFLEKQSSLPIQFGGEMFKLNFSVYIRELWPFLLLFVLALVCAFFLSRDHFFSGRSHRETPNKPTPYAFTLASIFASLSLAIFFTTLAFFVAVRSLELALAFAMVFIVLALKNVSIKYKKIFVGIVVILIAVQTFLLIPRFTYFMNKSIDPETLKSSALWLKEHGEQRTIVFNPHWDNFAQLFFWNKENYYINGMDPIFEYSLDPHLYWKTHYYAIDRATTHTCGEPACSKEMASTTEEALQNDFHAKYIVLQKRRTPNFFKYLDETAFYEKLFENKDEAVFRIKY